MNSQNWQSPNSLLLGDIYDAVEVIIWDFFCIWPSPLESWRKIDMFRHLTEVWIPKIDWGMIHSSSLLLGDVYGPVKVIVGDLCLICPSPLESCWKIYMFLCRPCPLLHHYYMIVSVRSISQQTWVCVWLDQISYWLLVFLSTSLVYNTHLCIETSRANVDLTVVIKLIVHDSQGNIRHV